MDDPKDERSSVVVVVVPPSFVEKDQWVMRDAAAAADRLLDRRLVSCQPDLSLKRSQKSNSKEYTKHAVINLSLCIV
jgi:hypothetical protein